MPTHTRGKWVSALVLATIVGLWLSPPAAAQSGWTSVDVGAKDVPGSAVENEGVWTLQGAGSDVWGSADAFHFLCHQVLGWYHIVVRVDDLQNTNPFAKAGLMLRGSLDPGAATVILDVKPNGEIEWMERASDGAEMFYIGGTFVHTPVWLQLDWRSNFATASISEDGVNWSTFGGAHFAPTSAYYYAGVAVTSHDDQQLNTAHVEGLRLAQTAWTSTDVGFTRLTGNALQNDPAAGSFTIEGAGADIWGAADAFQFVHQTETSVTNAGVEMRVVSEQSTNPFAKVGVMIRNGVAANAAFVILDMKPNGELEFMQRVADGGEVRYLGGATPGFNTWIALVRNGDSVKAITSSDGNNWSELGTTSVTLPSSAEMGIAVTSHETTVVNTAFVDQVSAFNGTP